MWKGRVPLNERGEAEVVVPLKRRCHLFRIVAVATGGSRAFLDRRRLHPFDQDLTLFLRPAARWCGRATVTVPASPYATPPARRLTVDVSARAPVVFSGALRPNRSSGPRARRASFSGRGGAQRRGGKLAWESRGGRPKKPGTRPAAHSAEGRAGRSRCRFFQASLARLEGRYVLPVERPPDALAGGGCA